MQLLIKVLFFVLLYVLIYAVPDKGAQTNPPLAHSKLHHWFNSYNIVDLGASMVVYFTKCWS